MNDSAKWKMMKAAQFKAEKLKALQIKAVELNAERLKAKQQAAAVPPAEASAPLAKPDSADVHGK